jgi:hypothetical protein
MVGKNVERKEGRLFKRVFRGGGEGHVVPFSWHNVGTKEQRERKKE